MLLLHDNDLKGRLPESWNLPSLATICLSNNAGLRGHLPASFFNSPQSSARGGAALTTMVIEGTGIGGALPADLCNAANLATLNLAGNRFSGPLPACVTRLQRLGALRLGSNSMTGTLPTALSNMTSLTTLDLSGNGFSGTIVASLGDISAQLVETCLDLNHFSCVLPDSVLRWKKAPGFKSLKLLLGNLFACPDAGALSYSMMVGAPGLVAATPEEADSYACGNADYAIPGLAAIVPFAVVLLAIGRGRLKRGAGWWARLRAASGAEHQVAVGPDGQRSVSGGTFPVVPPAQRRVIAHRAAELEAAATSLATMAGSACLCALAGATLVLPVVLNAPSE